MAIVDRSSALKTYALAMRIIQGKPYDKQAYALHCFWRACKGKRRWVARTAAKAEATPEVGELFAGKYGYVPDAVWRYYDNFQRACWSPLLNGDIEIRRAKDGHRIELRFGAALWQQLQLKDWQRQKETARFARFKATMRGRIRGTVEPAT